jgi:hypothetical protein
MHKMMIATFYQHYFLFLSDDSFREEVMLLPLTTRQVWVQN